MKRPSYLSEFRRLAGIGDARDTPPKADLPPPKRRALSLVEERAPVTEQTEVESLRTRVRSLEGVVYSLSQRLAYYQHASASRSYYESAPQPQFSRPAPPPPSEVSFSRRAGLSEADYEALGLSPRAPDSVVKAAYKALALDHHPDRSGDSEKIKGVNAAYERVKKARGL